MLKCIFVKRIDAHGIRLAVECLLLSGSNNLIMGFNSLNAYASVNQCHLHAYYMENRLLKATNPLPIQSLNVKRFFVKTG